ncbi:MAG: anti-sigma factor [Planctomycetota bacterium]
MSNQPSPMPSDDLHCDRAVFGPDHADDLTADHLSAEFSDFDQIAATYFLASSPLETETLPGSLRSKLLEAFPAATATAAAIAPAATTQLADNAPAVTEAPADGRNPLPWLVAIAASLLLGFLFGRPSDGNGDAASPVAVAQAAIDEAADTVTWEWATTDDPAAEGASGRVVWSAEEQQGYMVFSGLAVNDAMKEQYQLWVFDAERDERYPVDGGVFDIPAGQDEVIVPIDLRVPVAEATLFAITVEPPGGVVVSDRSRLPLLAKAPEAPQAG